MELEFPGRKMDTHLFTKHRDLDSSSQHNSLSRATVKLRCFHVCPCPCRNSAIILIFFPAPLRPGVNLLHSRPASPHSGGNRKQILESIVPTDSHNILDSPRSPDIVNVKYTEVARIWDSRFVSWKICMKIWRLPYKTCKVTGTPVKTRFIFWQSLNCFKSVQTSFHGSPQIYEQLCTEANESPRYMQPLYIFQQPLYDGGRAQLCNLCMRTLFPWTRLYITLEIFQTSIFLVGAQFFHSIWWASARLLQTLVVDCRTILMHFLGVSARFGDFVWWLKNSALRKLVVHKQVCTKKLEHQFGLVHQHNGFALIGAPELNNCGHINFRYTNFLCTDLYLICVCVARTTCTRICRCSSL